MREKARWIVAAAILLVLLPIQPPAQSPDPLRHPVVAAANEFVIDYGYWQFLWLRNFTMGAGYMTDVREIKQWNVVVEKFEKLKKEIQKTR